MAKSKSERRRELQRATDRRALEAAVAAFDCHGSLVELSEAQLCRKILDAFRAAREVSEATPDPDYPDSVIAVETVEIVASALWYSLAAEGDDLPLADCDPCAKGGAPFVAFARVLLMSAAAGMFDQACEPGPDWHPLVWSNEKEIGEALDREDKRDADATRKPDQEV